MFQLSFIQHSLMSPDVFCFADFPCHTVAIDILKAPPEDDNREIATWYDPLINEIPYSQINWLHMWILRSS